MALRTPILVPLLAFPRDGAMRLQIARGDHAGPRPVLTCELLKGGAARGAMRRLEQEVVFASHSLEIFQQFFISLAFGFELEAMDE
jgi:hypothetical protein